MPSETELKLDIPRHRLGAIAGRPWLKALEQARPRTEALVSVYFDTGKRALRDHHLALRVRRIGDKYLQTVKCGTSAVDRKEWEREIPSGTPDRDLARHTALKPFASKKKWRKLRPVFETKVERTYLPLRYRDARIELALDQGRLKAKGHAQPISEIELELKDGNLAALADLAGRLARMVPLELNLQSKAERGYALADGDWEAPVKGRTVIIASGQNAAEGFTAIALSCLQHLTANRAAILKGDAEGVHQMRVGLRRLRTALSLFKDLLRGTETEHIRDDLKWLSEELQPARDFDVFVEDEIVQLERRDGRHAPVKALKENLTQRRDQGIERARKMVAGDRYRRIVLETGLWAIAGEWARSRDDMQIAKRVRPLPAMAREILKARTHKVLNKLARLNDMDARARHKLRIAVKKLRYGAEFFEALYDHGPPRKERKLFMTRLKALQSALGRLNDIRVHEKFARKEVGTPRRGTVSLKRALGLGFVTGREREAVADCLAAAAKAGKRFIRHSRYWR
ncbi:MAG TPA: CHAD domain-containing protein [Rhizomicrobium sp.]|nr:CHAD domain-containing protein [Rhizomicrobium sp.]